MKATYKFEFPYNCTLDILYNVSVDDLSYDEESNIFIGDLPTNTNRCTSYMRASVIYGINNIFNRSWTFAFPQIESALSIIHSYIEKVNEGEITALDYRTLDKVVFKEFGELEKVVVDDSPIPIASLNK